MFPQMTVRTSGSVPGNGELPRTLRCAMISGLASQKSRDLTQSGLDLTLSPLSANKRLHCSSTDSDQLRRLRTRFTGAICIRINKETTRGRGLIVWIYAASSQSTLMMRQLIVVSIAETIGLGRLIGIRNCNM